MCRIPLHHTVRCGLTVCNDVSVDNDIRPASLGIRPYAPGDARTTLAVFLSAVTLTAAQDYSPDQVAAWAQPARREASDWDAQRRSADTFVATLDGQVAGFTDMSSDGYIDMLFVSPRFGRRGVGGTLLWFLEGRAHADGLTQMLANVSLTAKVLFERHGFVVTAERRTQIDDAELRSFRMVKNLTTQP